MKSVHVNTWLALKRDRELTIRASVERWMEKFPDFDGQKSQALRVRARVEEVQKVRRKNRKLAVDDLAPDGGLYSAGPQFRMNKPEGSQ